MSIRSRKKGNRGRTAETSQVRADAHNNLGNAYRTRGRVEDAVAEYRRALAVDPANTRARTNLADTLRASSR